MSFVPLSTYLSLPHAPDTWLIEPIIPTGGLVNLYGPPKVRKSFMALQMARDIAMGQEWLGHRTTKGRTLYLQIDVPRSLWLENYLHRIQDTFSPEVFEQVRFADGSKSAGRDEGIAPFPFNILSTAHQHWLRRQCDAHEPDFVIVDVWRRIFKGSEDKSEVVDEVINCLKAATQPAAVLVISHARKPNPDFDAGVLYEARGSGHLSGACDTILRLHPGNRTTPNKRLEYEGRATAATELVLHDEPNYLFSLSPEVAWKSAVRDALLREFPSELKRAEHLSALTGKTIDACRSALRRAAEGQSF